MTPKLLRLRPKLSPRSQSGFVRCRCLIATLFLPSCQRSSVAAFNKSLRTHFTSPTRSTAFLSAATYKSDITSQVLLGLAFASLVTRILGASSVVSTRLANFLGLNSAQLFARPTRHLHRRLATPRIADCRALRPESAQWRRGESNP